MKKSHLPTFGIGPIYVIWIMALTVIGMYLSAKGAIPFIKINKLLHIFTILGIGFIMLGLSMWIRAVIFSKIDLHVKNNKLLKTGIYANVRNPIYSAFMFVCTGIIIIYSNVLLLILPLIYWAAMTVIMKLTEEKWLYKLYGDEYKEYCKNVNRCIPWFKKK